MQQDVLIENLKKKDTTTFEYLFKSYHESILGVAFNILKNKELAEEVAQDVFLKVWNNIDSYSAKKGRLFTWMLNITRNAAIDKIRSKDFNKSKLNLGIDNFTYKIHSSEEDETQIDSERLKNIVGRLKEKCIKIIDYIYFRGYTQKEVSDELNIPIGTIKTRNRNCINELRLMSHG
mgnify:CR=1 FL=1